MTSSEMKHYVVVCNNLREWELFVELSTFNLSKQNHPYRLETHTNRLFDLHSNICYIYTPNTMTGYKLQGMVVSKIIQMCSRIDEDLYGRLVGQIK